MTQEHEYNTEATEDNKTPVVETADEKAEETKSDEVKSDEPPQVSGMTPTGQRLRAYFERIERLEEAKKEVSDDIREVFSEAKGDGFDVKAMRKIIAMRKKDPNDLEEENAIVESYMSALGMKL